MKIIFINLLYYRGAKLVKNNKAAIIHQFTRLKTD